MRTLKARLLVATPLLGDPSFERTVVYMLEHGGSGALGVVLNRPTTLEVGEPLPAWRRFAGPPGVVFAGGPVSMSSVIGVARAVAPMPTGAFEPVDGLVGVLDLTRDADELAVAVGALRVFAGCAGWGPGQLEGEIQTGSWYVVDAEPSDLFDPAPDGLWRAVLARQPGRLAQVARVPADLSLN
ncbi:MAG: YqgE/AlgH family protein [Acidimicrobiia bacterium]|nr:YqgE/AlgH family protein [Acidimicrobiia bacterium]